MVNRSDYNRGILCKRGHMNYGIIFILLFLLLTLSASAQQSKSGPTPPPGIDRGLRAYSKSQVVIPGVPAYLWHHGCGPTAVGMVIGYWDLNGPDNLVPGDASTQTPEVNAMIADDDGIGACGYPYSDHFQDYSCPIDYWPTLLTDRSETGGTHADNCVADFMLTSRSAYGNFYGWSWFSDVPTSIIEYISMVEPDVMPEVTNYGYWSFNWEDYKEEINNNRPLVLLVDTDGDGETDHFVTGIGYDDATTEYGIHDTWDTAEHWYQWREIGVGVPWGIYGVTTIRNIIWTRPYYILDSSFFNDNNGDGFYDPGDTVQFYFYVRNIGIAAQNVNITMTSDDPDVVFISSSISLPVINGEGTPYDNLSAPFEYIVPEVINPTFDSFFVTIESDEGTFQTVFGFEQVIGRTRILIVDDDRGGGYEEYYAGDLYQKRIPAHLWEKLSAGSPPASVLEDYDMVVWFTGDTSSDLIQTDDINSMKTYLDNGGGLFLTGQGLANELHNEDSAFLENYLKARKGDYYFHFIHEGEDGSPIGDGLQIRYYSMANQEVSWSQQIEVLPPAIPAFNFMNGGPSALSYEGAYKLVFFNWGYEAIASQFSNYATRDSVMTNILLFLDGWNSPPCYDSDSDGYGDPDHPENICAPDNCPYVYNPDQTDSDGNGVGDACEWLCGDVNNDGTVNIFDITFIISYLYLGGPAPVSLESADVNHDGQVNIFDITYLISYLYLDGAPPDCT